MQLSKFTTFVNSLYPHEILYLDSIQKFQDEETIKIMDKVRFNVNNPKKPLAFQLDIDKRKYSNLMKWIREKLSAADVDVFFEWAIEMDKKVNMDNLLAKDEKRLLKLLKTINPTSFFFIRFYELINAYRDYLLIRTRVFYYKSVQDYLQHYEIDYLNALELNKKMNNSAVDIILQHTTSEGDSIQWESFLTDTFSNKSIDGYTRYKAFVRITYVYYNYRLFDKLRDLYEALDKEIATRRFYSKRILANYYSNRAMMHSMFREMDFAEKYAFMSVRQKNSDYIFYLIKLCNILLLKNKNKKALELMTQNIPELKHTNSMYSRIGFVSMYLRSLNKNNMFAEAESYGDTFLAAYKNEIFNFRWHIFFCAYFQAQLKQEKYTKLISIEKRYNLVQKEKEFIGKARYVPTIQWYQCLARYLEGKISEKQLKETIISSGGEALENKYKNMRIKELYNELFEFSPNIFSEIKFEKLNNI
jgi:hypothetical protein